MVGGAGSVYHRAMIARFLRPLLLATILVAAPALADAQAPTPPPDARYAASSQGRVYYWIGCESRWGRLKAENIRFFRSAEEAEDAGYTPSRSDGCGRRDSDEGTAARGDAQAQAHGDAPAVDGGTCVIDRVVDGDTVVCAGGERVRLLLIDSPELSQAPFGRLARAALLRLLPPGTPAAVELDVQHRDRYGRVLAHLRTPDGLLVTEEMVRQGWAVVAVYPPNVRHVERFRELAAEARREGKGLWAEGGFECLPAERRRRVCEVDA